MATFYFKSIAELKGNSFIVPSLQRGYKWKPTDAQKLIDDFVSFVATGRENQKYCLQPLAICQGTTDASYQVLDGQQRLTTLFLLMRCLMNEKWYDISYERDKNLEDKDSRKAFLEEIDGTIDENKLDIDKYHIYKVYHQIKDWIDDDKNKEKIVNLQQLLTDKDKKGRKVCFMWYEITEEERHDIFESLNNGKIELTNSDLIKAYLLAETHTYDVSAMASQFNEIEQMFETDSFWHMLQTSLPEYNECRMDLVFNLALNIGWHEYKGNTKAAFDKISNIQNEEELLSIWKKVRDCYTILVDMYEDPFTYHYLGFLAYCGDGNYDTIAKVIKSRKEYQLSAYYDMIKTDYIKKHLKSKLSEYSYAYSSAGDLRRLFLLHNIETILQNYSHLIEEKHEERANCSFERFPFSLLHEQKWDIEHIASQTDNPKEKITDQNDWTMSLKTDEADLFKEADVQSAYAQYDASKTMDTFKKLYNLVIRKIDERQGSDKVINKDGIGNLVLLDSKTNRGYHNSLFPRKRRYIIENSRKYYIPICTRMVFMKFYNTSIGIKTNEWTQKDYESYEQEIYNTLKFYLEKEEAKK